MSDMIHGHEVMEMMLLSNKTYTKASLEAAIIEQFGEQTRFFTCSAENLTAKELVNFLQERGKFVAEGEEFTTKPEKICQH